VGVRDWREGGGVRKGEKRRMASGFPLLYVSLSVLT